MSRPAWHRFAFDGFDAIEAASEAAANDLLDTWGENLAVLQSSSSTNSVDEPQQRLVKSDPLFVKKSERLFYATVVYDDKNHYKGLGKEDCRRVGEHDPVKRTFCPPLRIQDIYDGGWIDDDVLKGLQSRTFHTMVVTTKHPETKETMHVTRYEHGCTLLKVLQVKEQYEDELHVKMVQEKGKPLRSVKTVEEISTIQEASVEVILRDGTRALMYIGGAKKLLCSAEASSEFLDKYFDHTHDIACLPATLLDYVFQEDKDNKKHKYDNEEKETGNCYVHYTLFARCVDSGTTDATEFSLMPRAKPERAGSLEGQVSLFGDLVSIVLPILVSVVPVQGHSGTAAPAPFCVPLHPQKNEDQKSGGHMVVFDENEGKFRLQYVMFSNRDGMKISTDLICTAGTKEGTSSQDLSIHASWETVARLFQSE